MKLIVIHKKIQARYILKGKKALYSIAKADVLQGEGTFILILLHLLIC